MLSNAIQLGERMMNQGRFEPVSSGSSGIFIDVKLNKSPFAVSTISKDGGPGSGNFGHEGVPGQVGGSAPSADNLNEGLKEAYSSKDYVEVQKKFRKTLKEVPVGSKFTSNGKQYTKTGEDEFESEGFKGRKVKNNTNMVVNSMDAFDVSKAPVFDEIKSENIAEAKGIEKYGQEKKVSPASSTKSNEPKTANVTTSTVELFRSKDSSEEDRIEVVERIKKENPMYDLSLNGSLANTLANKTGMNNPPELMSEKEFDNYVEKNGALKIYRGITGAYEDEDNEEGYHSAEEFRNEFETSKDSVYGGGNYGSGYHFSTEYRQARGFANSSNGDGTVFECAIKPNARIISEKELDSHESEWEWNTPYKGDSSAWAIAHGYDMVRKGEGDGRVVLVLNRNALIMKSQKANTDSSEENLGSVGILVVKDGKFLCGTRHNDFGYGLMCGPGGHIEKGESPEYAAIREADEEFSIIPTELISLGTGPTEPDTGLTPYLFLCTEYEGEPESGDLEITNIKFRSLDELAGVDMFQPFIDGIYQLLNSIVDKAKVSKLFSMNEDGGPGSGNHNHEGRPGEIGGSLSTERKSDNIKKAANCGKPKITKGLFNKRVQELFDDIQTSNSSGEKERNEVRTLLDMLPSGSKIEYNHESFYDTKTVFIKQEDGSWRNNKLDFSIPSEDISYDFLSSEEERPKVTSVAMTEEAKRLDKEREAKTYWRNNETEWRKQNSLSVSSKIKMNRSDVLACGQGVVVTLSDGTKCQKWGDSWYEVGTGKEKKNIGKPTIEGDYFDVVLGCAGISKEESDKARALYNDIPDYMKPMYEKVLLETPIETTKNASDTSHFSPLDKKIYLEYNESAGTVIHEIGHSFDKGAVDKDITVNTVSGYSYNVHVSSASQYLDVTLENNDEISDFESMASEIGITTNGKGWFGEGFWNEKDEYDIDCAAKRIDAFVNYADKHKNVKNFNCVSDAISGMTFNTMGESIICAGHEKEYWQRPFGGNVSSSQSSEYWTNFCVLKSSDSSEALQLLKKVTPNRYKACEMIFKEVFGDGEGNN